MQALGSKLQLPWNVTRFHGKQVKESFLRGSIWHQESGPITRTQRLLRKEWEAVIDQPDLEVKQRTQLGQRKKNYKRGALGRSRGAWLNWWS